MNRAVAISTTVLLIVGCNSQSVPNVDPSVSNLQPVKLKEVSFYVAGMNEQLKIL